MKTLAIFLILLAACTEASVATVPAADIQQALTLCEPNGGLAWARRYGTCETRGCTWRYWVEASCNNGASFRKASAAML